MAVRHRPVNKKTSKTKYATLTKHSILIILINSHCITDEPSMKSYGYYKARRRRNKKNALQNNLADDTAIAIKPTISHKI